MITTDLDFKQRQAEVEKSQVTMSIKIGQGSYGEVCAMVVNTLVL